VLNTFESDFTSKQAATQVDARRKFITLAGGITKQQFGQIHTDVQNRLKKMIDKQKVSREAQDGNVAAFLALGLLDDGVEKQKRVLDAPKMVARVGTTDAFKKLVKEMSEAQFLSLDPLVTAKIREKAKSFRGWYSDLKRKVEGFSTKN